MKTLNPEELRSIEQFFQLSQESLLRVMSKYLRSKYKTVYSTKEYVVAVGDIPIALVAHLDTVFSKQPANIFYDRIKNVMWSPEGLGADDRAGVYSIVQLIKRGLRPTVIFTTDEEKGALGAEKLVRDFPEAITELKYIIQLDRRGSNDCVFYDCDNALFEEYVETFDFVTAFGTFSDISVICPAWGIAGVNLSIGYVDEHSYSELLYIGNMIATINKVEKMLLDIENVVDEFEYIPAKYCRYYSSKYGYAYGYEDVKGSI
jgi:acetylornithine deacetylase/succinyl-diaminopimelate desuccinylase-like protein